MGLLLIAFAWAEWFSLAKRVNFSRRLLPVGGVLSGFFGGLSGHQGAFRSAFLLHAGLDPRGFIAANAAIASLVDVTRLLVYGVSLTLVFQQVDATVVAAAAVAAFAGVLAGRLGIEKVTIGAIQRLVAVMLVSLGVLLAAGIL